MRGMIRKIRYAIFLMVRPLFSKILRNLNPDYQVIQASATNASVLGDPGAPIGGGGGGLAAPVVLNSDRSLMTPEVLRFMLSGMGWSEGEIANVLAELGDSIDQVSGEEFDRLLENYLSRKIKGCDDFLYFKLYESLIKHRIDVYKNKKSYSVSGREYSNWVYWPDPTDANNRRSLYSELPLCKAEKFIDRSTKIVSAGSCFATEIAHYLIDQGYNYLVTEGNGGPEMSYEVLGGGGVPNASAAWGIIFNTPSFRQLVERAFGYRQLPRVLWSQIYRGEELFFDPFRENVAFRSVDAYALNYDEHTQAVKRAFSEMDVFIITLGLNEVWTFAADESVFSRSPWRTAPSLVRHRVMSVEENVSDLLRMTEILRYFNPGVKVICTVSPVPLHATFRADDQHVVVANAHSKAVLRVAAEEFVQRCPNTFYFPSYEIVTTATEQPWEPDQRHVSRAAVANVMSAFAEMYVK